jgi:hypothetical protein
MAWRSVRVEFPGAFYHVMARGNRHNPSSTVKENVPRLHTDPQFPPSLDVDSHLFKAQAEYLCAEPTSKNAQNRGTEGIEHDDMRKVRDYDQAKDNQPVKDESGNDADKESWPLGIFVC